MNQIEKKYGMKVKEAGGGGNCFYHSLSDQLKLQEVYIDHKELRSIAVKHIRNNKGLYEELMFQGYDDGINNIEDYIEVHSQDKTCADEIMNLAISRALNINIAVILSNENPEKHDILVKRREEAEITAFLLLVPGHYQSLIPPDPNSPKNTKFADLRNRVENEPIDARYKNPEIPNLREIYSEANYKKKFSEANVLSVDYQKTLINKLVECLDKKFSEIAARGDGKKVLNDTDKNEIKTKIESIINKETPKNVEKIDIHAVIRRAGRLHNGLEYGVIDKVKQFFREVVDLFFKEKKIKSIVTADVTGAFKAHISNQSFDSVRAKPNEKIKSL